MSAVIYPFRQCRRVGLVWSTARRMTDLRPAKAEAHLQRQIDIQRQTLLRKGVAPALIEPEMRALEAAVRTELWHLVLAPGGAA